MVPYTAEFRGEALAACDAGEGTRVVALRFHVSESWVQRIKQQRREMGQVAPRTAAPPQPQWQAWADWLVAMITARPDIYLRELQVAVESGLWRRGLPDDDLQCLSRWINLEKKDADCPGTRSS